MWQTEAVVMIRHYVNDLDPANYTYTDQRLQELFIVSAKKVNMDMSFGSQPVNNTFGLGNLSLTNNTIYTIDLENLDINPDPTSINDVGFMVLTGYQSAAILSMSEFKTAAGQALYIRDGSSAVDLRSIGREKKEAAEFYRKTYEDARFQYMLMDRPAYQAIMGPVSILSPGFYGGFYQNYTIRDRPFFN